MKLEFKKQILLRFTTIGGPHNQNAYALDHLPPNLTVIVNNKSVTLSQPKASTKPNADISRLGQYRNFSDNIDRNYHSQVDRLISLNTVVYLR